MRRTGYRKVFQRLGELKLLKKSYKGQTDEQLMVLVAEGKAGAFEEIYERYKGPLFTYFHRMLWKDREKAEDFVQDLFTKIVHKPHLYNPQRAFKTWLYSVANNMCKNEYRKAEVRKGTVGGLDDNMAKASSDVGGDVQFDRSNFTEALADELEQLDEKHRNVFILRFKHDLSIKEIADALDISDGTVKSRIFYALKKLSTRLKEFNPQYVENYENE